MVVKDVLRTENNGRLLAVCDHGQAWLDQLELVGEGDQHDLFAAVAASSH